MGRIETLFNRILVVPSPSSTMFAIWDSNLLLFHLVCYSMLQSWHERLSLTPAWSIPTFNNKLIHITLVIGYTDIIIINSTFTAITEDVNCHLKICLCWFCHFPVNHENAQGHRPFELFTLVQNHSYCHFGNFINLIEHLAEIFTW